MLLMGRWMGVLWVVWCSAVCPTAAQQADSALVELRAELMVIGKEGSRRAGSERAVVPPGKVGLLTTSVSLRRGQTGAPEQVSFELRIRVRQTPEGLTLAVDSRAQGQPSGELVVRSGGGLLTGTSPLFYEAYVSQATGERVVFLLSAHPWKEPPPDLFGAPPAIIRPVAYTLRIYRLTDDEPELLDSLNLASLVGRSTSYSFGFFVASTEGEGHREELQVRLKAVELRNGWLSGVMSLEGEVGGMSVSRSQGWFLSSGGETELDLELGGGDGREQGFRIRVNVRF